ncbi:hypothetical protein PHMEG_00032271 [Phytophthora megakarya]|uniref:MULE transposase domain-containing protein n=1 Tax=Phytophthora megakarya TaxID=4795 RepID=A0A225UWB6_9STRA|nr:hypothetical protein PHMEG_00032271 [Phytophthora megakarya]
MKEFVQAEIGMNSSVTPHVIFTRLCATMQGTPPLESQVQGYMKRWRAKNRDDSMQPVIDVCSRSMFELQQNPAQLIDELLVFCDSTYENGNLVPDIGDASDELPFRMGLTCYSLLHAYTTVQNDPRCVTVIHLDSTHNMTFFPLVYYCASQRRAEDIVSCLSYLKRFMLQRFATHFKPQYVMTDADGGQYNACANEIPKAKVLMCWFHVCQNVWKKSRKLPRLQRDGIFRDLNDLHFCRNEVEFETKKDNILSSWSTAGETCFKFGAVTKKIRRQWFDNPRFSKWQAFHTPPGYATTNNPVEQYHRIVKLVNSTSRATPIEMIQLLDQSRIGFLAKKMKFSSITQASKRLKAHYNKIKKRGELTARVLLPVGDLRSQLVLVKQTVSDQTTSNSAVMRTFGLRQMSSLNSLEETTTTVVATSTRKKKKKKSDFHADDWMHYPGPVNVAFTQSTISARISLKPLNAWEYLVQDLKLQFVDFNHVTSVPKGKMHDHTV